MWRYLVSAVLALHGLIHAIGFAAAWQLGALTGVTAAPSFPTWNARSAPVLVLGVLWLMAGAGFVLGGIGLAADRSWWVPAAAASALLSLVLTGMWWQSAPVGIAIDLAVLAFLVLVTRGAGAGLKRRGAAH
jgi:hypothetical protein